MSDWSRAVLWALASLSYLHLFPRVRLCLPLVCNLTACFSHRILLSFFPCMVIIGFSCELAGLMDLILCFICSRAVIAVDLWPWNYETRLGRVLHSSLYLTFHLPCFI